MSSPKKPLITRGNYKEFQKEQTKKKPGVSKQVSEMVKTKRDAKKMPAESIVNESISRESVSTEKKIVENSNSRKHQTTDKKNVKGVAKKTKDVRIDSKEKGRQLDIFLNKAIIFVILLIVLVFVVAFLL